MSDIKPRDIDRVPMDRVPKDNNNKSRNRNNGRNDGRGRGGGGSGGGGGDRGNQGNQRSSHRDRERNHDRNNGGHGGSNNRGGGPGFGNNNPGNKLSGMAFTETELMNDIPKKKFTGRCRLFVGNLPNEVNEAELKELFTPHGDIAECYLSGKGFAFLRLDTRAHAESAKEALDGKTLQGRQVRVRFAVHGATIRVKELAPVVSNEMLYLTFSAFGDVERAIHVVDEKGKPTGQGIIEFERKSSALEALQQIKDRVFLMTANSRPLTAEILEPKDEEDGLSERMLHRTPQLMKERELGPRFAALNSFEYVYGQRWKELYDSERKQQEDLEQTLRDNRQRLEADMEIAYEDYKTQLLREDLQRRQQELERLEAAKRDRMRHQAPPFGRMDGPPMGMRGGLLDQQQSFADGPMGRNPPTFGQHGSGVGQRLANGPPPGGMFFGGGNNGRPADNDVHKMNEVQKLLQTFKNDPSSQQQQQMQPQNRAINQPLEFFMHNNIAPSPQQQQQPGSLPNLLNVMGPFANALTSGQQGQPMPPRPPGGMPLPPTPLSDFQMSNNKGGGPSEKRMRR